jgi:hypothetical protein
MVKWDGVGLSCKGRRLEVVERNTVTYILIVMMYCLGSRNWYLCVTAALKLKGYIQRIMKESTVSLSFT